MQAFLSQSLPNYMVPTIYIVLDALPITANGKIDKKKLPAPLETSTLATNIPFHKAKTPTEKILTTIWAKALKIKKISIYDNFFSIGGHSLLITQILLAIKAKFNRTISLAQFYENITIHQLANLLDMLSAEEPSHHYTALMRRESSLANFQIPADKLAPAATVFKNILLTGATGFVGMHLLFELLKKTSANVYCFVRANDEADATIKIKASLKKYQLDLAAHLLDRIIPLVGDFDSEMLGLDQKQWQNLAEKIDVIYHNGAYVHHTYPYDELRLANVLSTVELIKIARTHKIKPFHYVSTVGSATKIDEHGLLAEDFPDSHIIQTDVGYYQTKWVSERLLTDLKLLNHPVAIYRLGRITGHSKTGICSYLNDHFQLFVKGCIQMGSAPSIQRNIDMAPVDLVASMVVTMSLDPNCINQAFNIYNEKVIHWDAYINWLKLQGFALQFLAYDEWVEELKKLDQSNALYPLIPFYLDKNYSLLVLENNDRPLPSNAKSKNFCKNYQLEFPQVGDPLLKIYLDYLIKENFL